MKKQTLANIAVAAAFLFTLNLAAQPRGPQKEWDGRGGKGAPAAKPAPRPNNGPAARPAQPAARPAQPTPKPTQPAPKPAQPAEPRRGVVVKTGPVIIVQLKDLFQYN